MDKLQLGYLGTVMECSENTNGIFRLQSKKWPFTEERFSLSGEIIVMQEDQKEASISLKLRKAPVEPLRIITSQSSIGTFLFSFISDGA